MRSRIYCIAISLTAALEAAACYVPIYRPQDLWIYRGVESEYTESHGANNDSRENLQLWQQQTGVDCPIEEIAQVVYRMDRDELSRATRDHANPFVAALALPANRDMMDCLVLAKEVETIRAGMLDPWYYPVSDDTQHQHLRELLQQCLGGLDGRMRDRYFLQAMRISTALRDYGGITQLWDDHNAALGDNVLRRMSADYAGGAYEHLGEPAKARDMYALSQNIAALAMINPSPGAYDDDNVCRMRLAEMENIYPHYPNHPWLKEKSAVIVHDYEFCIKIYYDQADTDIENSGTFTRGDDIGDIQTYRRLGRFAEEAAANPEVTDQGFWHYTAAFIAYLDGKDTKARHHIAKALAKTQTGHDRESVQALQILMDMEKGCDRATMLGHLQWMQCKVTEEATAHGPYDSWHWNMRNGYSTSYWQDVMRKACARGVDRLQEQGDHTTALLLSNYACYIPERHVQVKDYIDDNGCWTDSVIPASEVRNHKDKNYYDYTNQYFRLFDTLTGAQGAAYMQRVKAPVDALERFLVDNGYHNPDYENEHLATLYMREMDYANAVRWLEKVSGDYQKRTNISASMWLDPFKMLDTDQTIADNTDYKLRFAKRMVDLRRLMDAAKSADQRADAKLDYAIGLRNSYGRCWVLTQYEVNENWCDIEEEPWAADDRQAVSAKRSTFRNNQAAQKAYAEYDRLIAEALAGYATPEQAARAHLRLKNYKTLHEQYADTQTSRWLYCDTWRDYSLHRR